MKEAKNKHIAITDFNSYGIVKIIQRLGKEIDPNNDDLFEIEWYFFDLIDSDAGQIPISVKNRINTNPRFFSFLIQLMYKSTNAGFKLEGTDQDPPQGLAERAFRVLDARTSVPGQDENGHFDFETFRKWFDQVLCICTESGHREVALSEIGKVLIHTPPDPDGLWINKDVAELLDNQEYRRMLRAYEIAAYNSRGVHFVDASGEGDRTLSRKYTQKAECLESSGFINFAGAMRKLSETYENESYEH
jgi:hypothetical protein